MTSILDNTSAMDHRHHVCGGTVLSAHCDGEPYDYCDTCGAFAYGDAELPNGTDAKANQAAWDNGESESPSAQPVTAKA